MNDDSAQNIGIIGLISVAAILVIVVALAATGLVMTLVLSSNIPLAVEPTLTPVVEQPAEIEPLIVVPITTVTPITMGRLVVVSADQQLLTINADGSDLRELTQPRDQAQYSFPAWSPDNQHIAAIGNNPQGIYVFEDSADAAPLPIYTSDQTPIYLYWSPDSQQVSFITPRGRDSVLMNLNIAPSDGSKISRQMASGAPFYWDWNSDGSELLFNTNDSAHAEFAFLNANNGEIGDEIGAGAFFASPDISADDAYIAYSAGTRRRQHLIIANRAGVEQNNIRHVGLIAFAWSPAANQLAYTTPRRPFPSAYGALWLVQPQGRPRLLVDDDVITYYWSPDGTKIAYFTLADREPPELETNRARTVLASDVPIQDASNAQLELSVFDVVSGESMRIGRFLPSDLFIRQFIPFFDQYARSHSLWSPDSTALAMPVQENGGSVIYRFPIDGSLPTKLIAGEIAFWSR